MAAGTLPDPPVQLKGIQSHMKVAADVERIDPVVAYWVRLYAIETGFKLDKDSPECKSFLHSVIFWMEKFKNSHKDNEAISNPTVGQAHYENFVVALFTKADTLDREGTANKTTVRMFYMAAVLFEAMAAFGPLTDDISEKAKYAKFKAAYIQKCLKTGQTPKPGPLVEGADDQTPSADGGEHQPQSTTNEPSITMPQVPDNKAENSSNQDPFILTPSPAPARIDPPTPQQPQPTVPSVFNLPEAPGTTNYSSRSPSQTPGATSHEHSGSSISATNYEATSGVPLDANDLVKAQRYCKFANSALQYDDIPTAVTNLEKALKLLTVGHRSD